ncbi:MAG: hypothetical protein WCG27_05400, partial [Pseudomonadota bacterium]
MILFKFMAVSLRIILTLVIFLMGHSWCQRASAKALEGIQIQDVSTTGRSIIVNLGAFDGLQIGDKGKFYYQESKNFPLITYVGMGEAIKIMGSYSFWYMSEIHTESFLRKGFNLGMVRQKDTLRGQPVKLKQRKVVLPKEKTVGQYLAEKEEGGIPENLVKAKTGQNATNIVSETAPNNGDGKKQVTNFDVWSQSDQRYIEKMGKKMTVKSNPNMKKGVDLVPIREEKEDQLFNSVTDGNMNKYNELEHGL